VILVIRPDHTDRTLCQRALAAVPKPKLLGILLNCVPDWSPGKQVGSDYYYYHSGGKGYQSKREAEPPNANVRSPAAVLRE
jgi:Mrp family chromosome partitioning ATPase